jgi:glycosyltransferase involved in cell wall biosynthesis
VRKIALIVTNLAGSGAEKVVLNLARMFASRGDEVHVIMLEDIVAYDTVGIALHTLTHRRKPYKMLGSLGDRLLAKKLDAKLSALSANGKNFDLILSHLPAADRVAAYLNRSNLYFVIHTAYSMEIAEFKAKKRYRRARKKERLYRRLYAQKHLIAVSKGIRDDLDAMGIAYRSCRVIYNPFDAEHIRRKGAEPCPVEGAFILSASAFRPVKRHDILLDAYAKLEDPLPLKLLCNPHPKLEAMIRERNLQDRVEILGFTPDPYPYIRAAKLLVLTSEREGLPTVLIEALILGTPVVSTDCISGPSEILIGELKSFLAKLNDLSDIAEKMNAALLRYPSITPEYIGKFTESAVYDAYVDLLEDRS